MKELISREDLLKQIDIDSDGNRGQYGDEWFFIDTIKKMPTIKKALEITKYIPRPQGKWIEFTCSECGFTPLIKPMELNVTKGFMKCTYNYCPDCGSYNVHDSEKGAE